MDVSRGVPAWTPAFCHPRQGCQVVAESLGNNTAEYLESDVLIIGTGIAGATVALTLADAGIPVTLVTTRAPKFQHPFGRKGALSTPAPKIPHLNWRRTLNTRGRSLLTACGPNFVEEGPGAVRHVLLKASRV